MRLNREIPCQYCTRVDFTTSSVAVRLVPGRYVVRSNTQPVSHRMEWVAGGGGG